MCRSRSETGGAKDGAELFSDRHAPPSVGGETFGHLTETTFKLGGPIGENKLIDDWLFEHDVG